MTTWNGQLVVTGTSGCAVCGWYTIDRYDPDTLKRVGHREFYPPSKPEAG